MADREAPFPRLLGERLCLDFANTKDPRVEPNAREYLFETDDLVEWLLYAGAISDDSAKILRHTAALDADRAGDLFEHAIELREAIYRVFTAIADRNEPDSGDIDLIRATYADGVSRSRLARTPSGYALEWPPDDQSLDRVLWPISRSALELLTGGEPARIKRCAGADGGCGWLFFDVSRNGSRRWCSMEGCGSQAKMRRYRAKSAPNQQSQIR